MTVIDRKQIKQCLACGGKSFDLIKEHHQLVGYRCVRCSAEYGTEVLEREINDLTGSFVQVIE